MSQGLNAHIDTDATIDQGEANVFDRKKSSVDAKKGNIDGKSSNKDISFGNEGSEY